MARNTTPPGVKAVEDYTFDELITHLHDHHGLTAEEQANDETLNDTDPDTIARIRAMSREEAIARIPGYFQNPDGPDSLESARLQHAEDHANGPRVVHFHPGAWRTESPLDEQKRRS